MLRPKADAGPWFLNAHPPAGKIWLALQGHSIFLYLASWSFSWDLGAVGFGSLGPKTLLSQPEQWLFFWVVLCQQGEQGHRLLSCLQAWLPSEAQ